MAERLIDADALIHSISKKLEGLKAYEGLRAVQIVAECVVDAPTISLSDKRNYEAETKELVKIFLKNFSGNEKEIEAFCEMLVKNYVVVLLGPKDFGIKGPHGPRGVKIPVISMGDTPTIEAKPVVHAHWENWGSEGTVCSKCHGRVLYECDEHEEKSKFCPHCGAQMDSLEVKDE